MKNLKIDVELFNPLLMVNDFEATEFHISDEFMTNADVPTLATKDIIENPVNPFTGKKINNTEKTSHPQFVNSTMNSDVSDVTKNNGKVFNTYGGHWYSVHDNIFKEENWQFVE